MRRIVAAVAVMVCVVGCAGAPPPVSTQAVTTPLTPTATPEPLPTFIYIESDGNESGVLRSPQRTLYDIPTDSLSSASLSPDARYATVYANNRAVVLINAQTTDAIRHDLGADLVGAPLWLPDSSAVLVQAVVRDPDTDRALQLALVRIGVDARFEPLLQFAASPQGDLPLIIHVPTNQSAILRTPDGSARLLDLTTGRSQPMQGMPLAVTSPQGEGPQQVAYVQQLTRTAPTPLFLAPFDAATGIGEGRLITPNDFFYTIGVVEFAPSGEALAMIAGAPGSDQSTVLIARDLNSQAPVFITLDPPEAGLQVGGIAWLPDSLIVGWGGTLWRYPNDGALPQRIGSGFGPSAPP